MAENFRNLDRQTPFFMPPSVDDWLPEGHLARFIVEIVERLDLTPIRNAYSGRGQSAHDPRMLLALLFYGYATGIFSSRKLERATYDSVAFRYIAGNEHPDHDTVAAFRKRFLPELSALFIQILQISQQMKVLKLGNISLDGTKIHANASKHSALSWEHACKIEEQIKAEAVELLRLAESADKNDLPDGYDIPEELSRREDRLAAIAAAKAEMQKRAAERYAQEEAEYKRKLEARKAKEEETGQKARGREPKAPEPGVRNKDQVNLTDEESRIMPKSGGGFEQSYNAQASVDVESMLVVGQHITQEPNDKEQLAPALEILDALPEELGKVETILADAGYFSEKNVELCHEQGYEPYIAPGREGHNPTLQERFQEPPELEEGASAVARMKRELKTPAGRTLYGKRKSTVEPVFGVIKAVMGFRQFLLRGLKSVRGEWTLVCMAWNLKRLHVLTK
ncbi:MAG: IS1182 family transposase [Alphaproteobacteria bacterium]